ncbi:MAG: response regulator transcription factor [Candidatus Dormibacteraeota bacterium]|nr:response regulator transcription factor [Candidatus Dormibacteraeota bacterium]MBO0703983.1 response regulator transcription factor [Candidatus Dormibacteraeota bacterium]MBO0760398.1 response regulator transcription factor [Candidatus Dormibacteraeota bacterium]
MSRIILIEDDEGIAETLRFNLEASGHTVQSARDGGSGLRLARTGAPDLILLDLMLPGMDGVEVCRQLRRSSGVPIIMLTARDSEVDRILGLELGADDYVTKPFSIREVLARIAAVLRRAETGQTELPALPEREVLGNFVMDRAARRVMVDGVEVRLALREFELLSFLIGNPGRAHTRDALIQSVWGPAFSGDQKTVDVHIRWLREKFMHRAPFEIVTVRGVGYRLDRLDAREATG